MFGVEGGGEGYLDRTGEVGSGVPRAQDLGDPPALTLEVERPVGIDRIDSRAEIADPLRQVALWFEKHAGFLLVENCGFPEGIAIPPPINVRIVDDEVVEFLAPDDPDGGPAGAESLDEGPLLVR